MNVGLSGGKYIEMKISFPLDIKPNPARPY
jgi:hypothetical protein